MPSTMFSDGNLYEKLAELKVKDKGLVNKIRQFINNVIAKFRKIYAKLTPDQKDAIDIREMKDVFDHIQTAFAEALVEASDNFHVAESSTQAKENTTNGGVQMSIRDRFYSEIDSWDGKSKRTFVVGRTSDVLKNLGVKDSRIIWYGEKIARIMRKHGGMDKTVIKQVPQILEKPAIILTSKQSDSRLVMFGTVTDSKGTPVTAILELQPTNKGGQILDMNIIASAYGKDNTKNLVESSGLVYIDPNKKRTKSWMQSVGLQLPSDATAFGSVGSITYLDGEVKIKSLPYGQYMQKSKNDANGNTKFQLREPVEYTKDLVALHNLTEDKLTKSLKLGGFPMPSIAVTRSDIPHTNFGDITLVFGKETIDPKASRKNTVYSADAWTPTFPQVEYEADRNVSAQIGKKYYDIAKQYGYDFARPLYSSANYVEGVLNRYGGEQGIIEHFADNTDMMQVFLADSGKTPVENVMRETVTRISDDKIAEYDSLIGSLGEDVLRELTAKDGQSPLEARKEWLAKYGERLKEAFRQYLIADGMAEATANEAVKDIKPGALIQEAIAARNYLKNGAETRKTGIDTSATQQAIRNAVDAEEYRAWLQSLYAGVEKDKGIYNGKERYTASGNLKSFKQTHVPVTLDGIVKAMAAQNGGNTKNVSGFNGVKSLRAGTAERFSSIADMHEREGRLQHLTQEQADQITEELQNRTYDLIERIDKANSQKGDSNSLIRYDTIGNILMEIAEGNSYNVSDIQKVFGQYSRAISDDLAMQIKQLLFDISQMPVNIFEAKPERAVAFSEIKAAVLPEGTSQEVVNGLQQNGVPVMFYEKGNDGQRLELVNSMEGVKFSERDRQYSYKEADIDNFDIADYTAIKLSGAEHRRLEREAMAWNPDKVGRVLYQTLSNNYTYVYYFDEAHNITVLNKFKATNIHERHGVINDRQNRREIDRNDGRAGSERRIDSPAVFSTNRGAASSGYRTSEKAQYEIRTSDRGRYAESTADTDKSTVNEQFSERDRNYDKTVKRLEAQNETLREDVAYLKQMLKLQKSLTHGKEVTKSSVEAAARVLKKYADATGSTKELAGLLNDLYRYIASGDELTWEGVMEKAQPAVDWLMENKAERLDPYAQQVLGDIKGAKVYLDETQKQEVISMYGSMAEFKRMLGGSVTVSDNANMSLNSWWHEMAGMYPDRLDDSVSAADMPLMLTDIIDTLKNMRSVDDVERAYNRKYVEQDLLRQVYDSYWNVSTLYTVADVKQKQIDKLKARHAERMQKVKDANRETIQKIRKEHREKMKAAAQKRETGKEQRELRYKIRKKVRDLNKLLNRGNRQRNVKQDMKGFVSKSLELADYLFTDHISNDDLIRRGITVRMTESHSFNLVPLS